MNKSFSKTLCSALILSIFFLMPLLPCRYTYNTSELTDPCVALCNTKTQRVEKYIVFCAKATLTQDPWGRSIPVHCGSFGVSHVDCSLVFPGHYVGTLVFREFETLYQNGQEYHREKRRFYYQPHKAWQPIANEQVYQKKNYGPVGSVDCEGFVPQTVVCTPYGKRPIGSLTKGDSIYTYDFDKSIWTETLVIATNTKSINASQCISIEVDGRKILCGMDQKFYLPESKKWVTACQLKPGEKLVKRLPEKQADFQLVAIENVVAQSGSAKEIVFVTLENNHNLCVGEDIMAHNCNCVFLNGMIFPVFCPDAWTIKGWSEVEGEFFGKKSCPKSGFVGGAMVSYNPTTATSRFQSSVTINLGISPQSFVPEFQSEFRQNILSMEIQCNLDFSTAQAPESSKDFRQLDRPNTFEQQAKKREEAKALAALEKERIRQASRDFRQNLRNDIQAHLAETARRDAPRVEVKYEQGLWEQYDYFFDGIEQRREFLAQEDRENQFKENIKNYNSLVTQAHAAAPECNRKASLTKEFQESIDSGKSSTIVGQENLCAQEEVELVKSIIAVGKIDQKEIENFEQTLLLEVANGLENVKIPQTNSGKESFNQDIFAGAIALALATTLGLKTLQAGRALLQACSGLSTRSLYLNGLLALTLAQGPIKEATTTDMGCLGETSSSISIGCREIVRQLTQHSSTAKDVAQVIAQSVALEAIKPYIVPVIVTALAVKAVVMAAQTQTVTNAIDCSKTALKKVLQEIAEGAKKIGQKLGLLAPATAPALINGDLGAKDFLRDDPTQPSQDLSSSVAGTKLLNNSLDQTTEREADETQPPCAITRDTNQEKSQNGSLSGISKEASLKTLLKPSLESILDITQKEIIDQANAEKQSYVNPAFKISIEPAENNLSSSQSGNITQKITNSENELAKDRKLFFNSKCKENFQLIVDLCNKEIAWWKDVLLHLINNGYNIRADKLTRLLETLETKGSKYMTLEALSHISSFGKELLEKSIGTNFFYPFSSNGPARIYSAKIGLEKYGIKEGDFFYLDLSYDYNGDHLEVFFRDETRAISHPNKMITARTVLNFDGTQNFIKTQEALGFECNKNNWILDKEKIRVIDHWVKL